MFDAIQHVRQSDIRIQSTVTNERSDGSTSLDPGVHPIAECELERVDDGEVIAVIPDGWIRGKLARLKMIRRRL